MASKCERNAENQPIAVQKTSSLLPPLWALVAWGGEARRPLWCSRFRKAGKRRSFFLHVYFFFHVLLPWGCGCFGCGCGCVSWLGVLTCSPPITLSTQEWGQPLSPERPPQTTRRCGSRASERNGSGACGRILISGRISTSLRPVFLQPEETGAR